MLLAAVFLSAFIVFKKSRFDLQGRFVVLQGLIALGLFYATCFYNTFFLSFCIIAGTYFFEKYCGTEVFFGLIIIAGLGLIMKSERLAIWKECYTP
jgi:hypothetical protein